MFEYVAVAKTAFIVIVFGYLLYRVFTRQDEN